LDLRFDIYEKDCFIKFKFDKFDCKKYGVEHNAELIERLELSRGQITRMSFKSIRSLKLKMRNMPETMKYMVTLTYPSEFPCDGSLVKKHIHSFLTRVRQIYPKIKFLWVLEFQKRGAPHLHVIFDEIKLLNRKIWISHLWYKIVGSGDSKHLRAGTRVESIRKSVIRYFHDYLKKAEQKRVPEGYSNVGRFWSCSYNLVNYTKVYVSAIFYKTLKNFLSPFIEKYQEKCKKWGFDWEFKDRGFIFYESANFIKDLIFSRFSDFKNEVAISF
jgi:hypothetical protein